MIEQLTDHDKRYPLIVADKLNELIDKYNNHLHEQSSSGGIVGTYQPKTSLPIDIGFRNSVQETQND